MKKPLRHIRMVLALALVALTASSCAITKLKDIALLSTGVKYIVPTSARSLDAMLLLEVSNPSVPINVTSVSGNIRYGERVLAHIASGQTAINGKSVQVYELPCTVTLAQGVSLLDVLAFASRRKLDGLKMDLDVTAALRNGLSKTLPFTDIDLSQFKQ